MDYYNLPEVTEETLKDGWLMTGDKGELDEEGRVKITDRIKNLIKTSGGKYVAPAHLEGSFKAICPIASQIVVHGDNRNFCTALITLDPDAMNQWAAQNGLSNLGLRRPDAARESALGGPGVHRSDELGSCELRNDQEVRHPPGRLCG